MDGKTWFLDFSQAIYFIELFLKMMFEIKMEKKCLSTNLYVKSKYNL